jgi:hypothetical protein
VLFSQLLEAAGFLIGALLVEVTSLLACEALLTGGMPCDGFLVDLPVLVPTKGPLSIDGGPVGSVPAARLPVHINAVEAVVHHGIALQDKSRGT